MARGSRGRRHGARVPGHDGGRPDQRVEHRREGAAHGHEAARRDRRRRSDRLVGGHALRDRNDRDDRRRRLHAGRGDPEPRVRPDRCRAGRQGRRRRRLPEDGAAPEGFRIPIDFGMAWSPKTGVVFHGGATLEVELPINLDLSIIKIPSIFLSLGAGIKPNEPPKAALGVAATVDLEIGPVFGTVEQMGVIFNFAFPEKGREPRPGGSFDRLQAAQGCRHEREGRAGRGRRIPVPRLRQGRVPGASCTWRSPGRSPSRRSGCSTPSGPTGARATPSWS